MTALVDVNNAPGDLTELKKDLTEATAPVEQAEPAPEHEVPEKYKGKSVDDVIDMHRNAESALGRSANELGQYKQLTDRLLELKRPSDLQKGGADPADIEDEPLPDISSTDLIDNPTESISRVVEARLTKDARKRQAKEDEDALTAAQADFATRHPDAGEIAQKEDFRKWVNESPTRLRAAREAYNKDFQAGTDLLDEWKASHTESADAEDISEVALKEAKKASTVTTGASQTGDIPVGKTYRRLDLIRLKLEDPEAYEDESFQQEIIKAYHEGRVK